MKKSLCNTQNWVRKKIDKCVVKVRGRELCLCVRERRAAINIKICPQFVGKGHGIYRKA